LAHLLRIRSELKMRLLKSIVGRRISVRKSWISSHFFVFLIFPRLFQLLRAKHSVYASRGLIGLPPDYSSLDASRAWLCYWITNSLDLVSCPIPNTQKYFFAVLRIATPFLVASSVCVMIALKLSIAGSFDFSLNVRIRPEALAEVLCR
jgi:hypothetical protein